MSVASWYYCNLLEEASAFVPVVQARQNAEPVGSEVRVVRSAAWLALGAEVDDELSVGRSTYVQLAVLAATSDAKTEEVVVNKTETVEVEAAVESVPEPVAEPEAVQQVKEEVVEPVVEVAKEEAAVPAAVEVIEETAESVVTKSTAKVAEPVDEVEELAAPVAEAESVEPESVQEDMEEVMEPVAVAEVAPTAAEVTESAESVVAEEGSNEEAAVRTEDVAEPAVNVVGPKVKEPVAVETVVQETVSEVATVVETVHEAVETVAADAEVVAEPVAAQAVVEEDKTPGLVASEEMVEEAIVEEVAEAEVPDVAAAAAPASLILSSDIPDEKLLDKAEDALLDAIDDEPRKLVARMPSIPEDDERGVVVEADLPVEESAGIDQLVEAVADELVEPTAVEQVEEAITEEIEQPTTEELAAVTKPVTDYESETQSEISEVPAVEAIAKADEEPESEIDETMVIDPDVAAKEAAASEARASSYSFIPDKLRQNSYAVSSIAVAVATAIAATVMARR